MTYTSGTFAAITLTIVAPAAISAIPRDARRSIDAANREWLAAMERHDAVAIAEPYSDDSVFVTPTGESVRGPRAVEQLMRDRFEKNAPIKELSLAQDGTVAVGSMVYEWGHVDGERVDHDRSTTKTRGRYLTVWRRDSDGRWRILHNLSLPE